MKSDTKKMIVKVLEQEIRIPIDTIDPSVPIREQISIDSMQFISIIARLEVALEKTIPISIMGVSTLDDFFSEMEKCAN